MGRIYSLIVAVFCLAAQSAWSQEPEALTPEVEVKPEVVVETPEVVQDPVEKKAESFFVYEQSYDISNLNLPEIPVAAVEKGFDKEEVGFLTSKQFSIQFVMIKRKILADMRKSGKSEERIAETADGLDELHIELLKRINVEFAIGGIVTHFWGMEGGVFEVPNFIPLMNKIVKRAEVGFQASLGATWFFIDSFGDGGSLAFRGSGLFGLNLVTNEHINRKQTKRNRRKATKKEAEPGDTDPETQPSESSSGNDYSEAREGNRRGQGYKFIGFLIHPLDIPGKGYVTDKEVKDRPLYISDWNGVYVGGAMEYNMTNKAIQVGAYYHPPKSMLIGKKEFNFVHGEANAVLLAFGWGDPETYGTWFAQAEALYHMHVPLPYGEDGARTWGKNMNDQQAEKGRAEETP